MESVSSLILADQLKIELLFRLSKMLRTKDVSVQAKLSTKAL